MRGGRGISYYKKNGYKAMEFHRHGGTAWQLNGNVLMQVQYRSDAGHRLGTPQQRGGPPWWWGVEDQTEPTAPWWNEKD